MTDLAQLAAQALARSSGTSGTPSVDAQTVELVARAIRARRQARRVRWIAGGLVAAAAAAIGILVHGAKATPFVAARTPASSSAGITAAPDLALGAVDSVTGDAELETEGGRHSLARGSTIAVGDEITLPPRAEVAFTLPTGTRITVDDEGDLRVLDQGRTQIFQLSAGSMRAQVHKLASGERFLVRTVDAEVEVRGTSFRVAMVAADDPCRAVSATHVEVYEGVVSVRPNGAAEVRIGPGGTWPAECGSPGLPSPPPARTPSSTAPASTAPASTTPASFKSQLAEQNDLYGMAVALREKGEGGQALAVFERLVKKYPAGPLAENATVERMRLLATSHAPEAGHAATDYLAKYPAGFARKDAEAILARDRNAR